MDSLSFNEWKARTSMLLAFANCHVLPVTHYFNDDHYWDMGSFILTDIQELKKFMDPVEVDVYYLEEHPEVVYRLQKEVYVNSPNEYRYFFYRQPLWEYLIKRVS